MRQASDHQDNSVVAAAKDTLGLDAEPLLPCDGDEIRRETRARNLPIAFDRNAGGALAGRSRALDNEIVCKPAEVTSLPLHSVDLAELLAERVGPGQEIEKKARGNAVLIAEAGSGSELNRGFLLWCGFLHGLVRGTVSRTFQEHLQRVGGSAVDEQPLSFAAESIPLSRSASDRMPRMSATWCRFIVGSWRIPSVHRPLPEGRN